MKYTYYILGMGMCTCVVNFNCCVLVYMVIFLQKLKEGYLTKAPDLTKGASGFKVKGI